MSRSDHDRVSEVFLAARRLPPAERRGFLDCECDGNAALRDEVEALLAHDSADDGFLERPAVEQASFGAGRIPERIGDYLVHSLIGEGGMGIVYLAEQQRPRRRVALKVMRSAWASPRMLKRFEHETQMLARLQHAGIAQIFEAAVAETPAGPLPYFAMEYVEGLPITEYVKSRGLSVRERLALMIRVCEAVQHAHQKGVIHRDLKPANVLVTEEGAGSHTHTAPEWPSRDGVGTAAYGQPKILDFGIARVAEPDGAEATLLTRAGELVGTLPYMSPEQISGNPSLADTRCDIYALGLILYEILGDRTALDLDRCSLTDATRIIREQDPPRLGSIDRAFRGDPENIVAKAVEKDRERRYQSAGELAADIQRYLDDQPIVARSASRMYQIRKFAWRNRALVAGIAVAFVALSAGVVAATWQAIRAQRAAQRTEKVNHYLRQMFAAIDPHEHGREVRVLDVVKRAAGEIDRTFGDEPLLEAAVRVELASILLSLGELAEAEPHFAAALDIRTRELGEAHPDSLASYSHMGLLRSKQARYAEAEPLLRVAFDGRRRVLGPGHSDTLATTTDLATTLHAVGKVEEAEALCRSVLPEQTRLHGEDHIQTLTTVANLASILQASGKAEEAEAFHHRAMEGLSSLLGPDHPTTLISVANLARLLKEQKRYREAEPLQRRVVDGLAGRLGDQHPDALIARANLAMILWRQDKLDQAEALYRRVIDDFASVFGQDHNHVVTLTTQLALVLERQSRIEEATALLTTALEGHRRIFGADHARTIQVGEHLSRVQHASRQTVADE